MHIPLNKYKWFTRLVRFTGGLIRLFSDNLKTTPIVSVLEANPIPVQYVTFASFDDAENQFFYNCTHVNTAVKKIP